MVETSFAADDELVKIAALIEQPLEHVTKIGAGRNSRVYKIVQVTGEELALKHYYGSDTGLCERMIREFNALEFLWENGIRSIPRPVRMNFKSCLASYEFVSGEKPVTNSLGDQEIDQAVEFLINLHRLYSTPLGDTQPWASEAFISFQTVIDTVDQRYSRLQKISDSHRENSNFSVFLNRSFFPVFGKVVENIYRHLESFPALAVGTKTLSPSDFGFHNVLCKKDGSLIFVDFEHFGCDDPVKLIADIYLHPHSSMQFKQNLKRDLLFRLVEYFGSFDQMFSQRLALALPLFGLKWCMILLNEFAPDSLARRKHALDSSVNFTQKTQKIQLRKAEKMLFKVIQHNSNSETPF